MVGEGLLNVCLERPDVEAVLLVSRRSAGLVHPKLKEVIHENFFDFSDIAADLDGYNACYFCLGVTSLGKTEADYTRLTYQLTLAFAKTLCLVNRDMTFCYVSGKGTDRTEKGRVMWAGVKGRTENALDRLSFKKVFSFRPGFIRPANGNRHTQSFYKYLNWLFPVGRILFPGSFCTLEELSHAMVNATYNDARSAIFEVTDIQHAAAIIIQ